MWAPLFIGHLSKNCWKGSEKLIVDPEQFDFYSCIGTLSWWLILLCDMELGKLTQNMVKSSNTEWRRRLKHNPCNLCSKTHLHCLICIDLSLQVLEIKYWEKMTEVYSLCSTSSVMMRIWFQTLDWIALEYKIWIMLCLWRIRAVLQVHAIPLSSTLADFISGFPTLFLSMSRLGKQWLFSTNFYIVV